MHRDIEEAEAASQPLVEVFLKTRWKSRSKGLFLQENLREFFRERIHESNIEVGNIMLLNYLQTSFPVLSPKDNRNPGNRIYW